MDGVGSFRPFNAESSTASIRFDDLFRCANISAVYLSSLMAHSSTHSFYDGSGFYYVQYRGTQIHFLFSSTLSRWYLFWVDLCYDYFNCLPVGTENPSLLARAWSRNENSYHVSELERYRGSIRCTTTGQNSNLNNLMSLTPNPLSSQAACLIVDYHRNFEKLPTSRKSAWVVWSCLDKANSRQVASLIRPKRLI